VLKVLSIPKRGRVSAISPVLAVTGSLEMAR
jgi:hypothetical protein